MPTRLEERRPPVLVQGGWLFGKIADWVDAYSLHQIDAADPQSLDPALAAQAEILVWDGSLLSPELLDSLPGLRLVAGFATGYAGADLADLRARAITLTNGAGVNAHDVADHAVAMLLGLWNGLADHDRAVRDGRWQAGKPLRPTLRGRKVGIVGLGRIGQAIADRLAPHDLAIRWWGPRPKPDACFARADDLLDLARWSDILIVASLAIEANREQIDEAVLDALGANGILINISRGMLVDEEALLMRLRDHRLGGAALDVFAVEPVAAERWTAMPNVLLTPHVAGATQEGGAMLFAQLRENVDRYYAGLPLLTKVDDPA